MNKKVYICTGTCKAEISEKQYKNGLVRCGTKDCNMYGHEFEERLKCSICTRIFAPGENHHH